MPDQPSPTPPRRQGAVALEYDPEHDTAPRLIAKGRGTVAERILALARENGIPIVHDPDLVEVLSAVELDREIPSRLYAAVAEILAFVYRLNQGVKEANA